MARTRNSDPGRVKPLHYAATPRQRHAKRLVYAYFARLRGVAASAGQSGLMAIALAAVSAGVAAQPEGAASSVPCVACQALSALPAQVFSFPEELAGAPVLIRLAPGTSAAEWLAPPHEIRRRGRLPTDAERARPLAAAAAALRAWLPAGLVAVSGRSLTCEGRLLHVLLNSQSLDLVAVSRSCPAPALVKSDVPGAVAERLDVGQVSVFGVRAGVGDRFAEGVDVAAARPLYIDEILARHQAAAARQAAGITSAIATGSLTLTFEAPGFVAPITITSQTTTYRDRGSGVQGRVDLRQHEIGVSGVLSRGRGGVPRLPIIEPERAAAPPLAITLSDVYRYRLVTREPVDGRDCYVVAFGPHDRRAPLYEGRAWIDAATFGMVRVSASQTGLKGPITASEQDDEFTLDSGRWRLARSNVRQTYEGASVRTPIHRLLMIDRYEVNPPGFAIRRAEAYTSADVMLRDTPEGDRYLRKEGGKKNGNGTKDSQDSRDPKDPKDAKDARDSKDARDPRDSRDSIRVIAGRSDRIRTLAFGVLIDPNISQPLPFAGVSYVDFNLFGTGAQFSGFFGGSYGQLAFSAPSIRGTRWQLAGRAFGIASSYNDRAFARGREQYALDIRQRPAQAAVWVLRPVTARTALRLEYDWDYTKFGATDVTDPAFTIPRNQSAHALRAGLDLQRSGWQASLWGSYAHRIGWRPWGGPALAKASAAGASFAEASAPGYAPEYRPGQGDHPRYGISLLRSQALSPPVTPRVEAAAMAGRDLDRFSRFAFGTFDNRLHGYPSALVRYDRGAVLRPAVAWSPARGPRLDPVA